MLPHEHVILEISRERERQITSEGWSPEHDDKHRRGEMALAAAAYAQHGVAKVDPWVKVGFAGRSQMAGDFSISDLLFPTNWDWKWWKPKDHRANLVRAAALIVAEIERLDRKS